MPLTPQDIMYITISIVVAVTGTLLSVALYKVVQILWVFQEITGYYYNLKNAFHAYEQVPQIIIEKIKEFASSSTEKIKKKKNS